MAADIPLRIHKNGTFYARFTVKNEGRQGG
jgi:hypothetical protein